MEEGSGGSIIALVFVGIFYLLMLAVGIASVIAQWKVYEKAGKPGWAILIPIYNIIVLLEIIDRPVWWILLLICTGPIGLILIGMDLAENFGKDKAFGAILLGLISPVGYLLIGFGDAQYTRISRQ